MTQQGNYLKARGKRCLLTISGSRLPAVTRCCTWCTQMFSKRAERSSAFIFGGNQKHGAELKPVRKTTPPALKQAGRFPAGMNKGQTLSLLH